MKTAVIAIALLGLFAGASALDFDSFTAKYSKTYHSMDERSARKAIFTANVAKVESLNAEARANGAEEVFGMSPFLDMTTEEFKGHLGLKGDLGFEADVPVHKTSSLKSAPSSMDWRQKGAVTPVKNQEQCGSCWAFSATESIESCNFIAGNPLDVLAPEQIVDCDTTCDGCQGGLPSSAFKYVMGAGGLEWSKDYPYTAGGGQAGQCNFQKSDVAETIAGWSYATQEKSETAMMDAMATKGPLSVCVDASAWQFYSGGVMQPSSCGTQLDHAVQAVGYTGEYWIVRNSWGASWGEQGYIRLAYGKNTCGVAQLPTYCTARKA